MDTTNVKIFDLHVDWSASISLAVALATGTVALQSQINNANRD